MMKELKNVRVTFKVKGKGSKPPPGYRHVNLLMTFDIKMDLTYEALAQLVGLEDHTETLSTLTYSSIITRESVYCLSEPNDLEMKIFDIGNTYLNAHISERLYTCAVLDEKTLVSYMSALVPSMASTQVEQLTRPILPRIYAI